MTTTTDSPRYLRPLSRGRENRGRSRRFVGTFLLVLVVLALPASQLLAQDPPAQDPDPRAKALEKALGEMDGTFNGSIVVGGSVVDGESGRPLGGVRLVITTGKFDPREVSLRSEETVRQTVDGAFRYECESCADVRVRFMKDGYHSEVRRFLAADAGGENPALQKGALAIAMQPVGQAAVLHHHRARLVVDSEPEKNRVMAVGERPRSASSLEKARSRAEKAGEPLRYVRLVTELDDEGEPRAVARKSILGQSAAVSATLDFSTADGGVIAYQPRALSAEAIRREMVEAPAEGYRETLGVDPEATGPTYFYVRIGELYGRGLAHPPSLETTSTGRRLVVSTELFLNPDGSRNLETVE